MKEQITVTHWKNLNTNEPNRIIVANVPNGSGTDDSETMWHERGQRPGVGAAHALPYARGSSYHPSPLRTSLHASNWIWQEMVQKLFQKACFLSVSVKSPALISEFRVYDVKARQLDPFAHYVTCVLRYRGALFPKVPDQLVHTL